MDSCSDSNSNSCERHYLSDLSEHRKNYYMCNQLGDLDYHAWKSEKRICLQRRRADNRDCRDVERGETSPRSHIHREITQFRLYLTVDDNSDADASQHNTRKSKL